MAANEKLYGKMQQEIAALADSINEIVDKFRALHNPLNESRERVPKATEQLDKISQQTEAAATQMLDRVEGITQREEEVMDGLAKLKERIAGNDLEGIEIAIDELVEKANTSYNDAFLIMDALQFQDITAQQMNHAAQLLEDVGDRLHAIISVIQGEKSADGTPGGKQNGRRRVFDPHADLSDKKTIQADIDSLFESKK